MNRLIIVGNGFDLAHPDLKTKYEDFIIHLIKSAILSKLDNKIFNSKLFEIEIDDNEISLIDKSLIEKIETIEQLKECSLISIPGRKAVKKAIRIEGPEFIAGLFENKNWTDVESYYFKRLIKFFDSNNVSYSNNISYVEQINEIFELLKAELILYLKDIDKTSNRVVNQLDYVLDKFCIDNSLYLMYGERRKVELNDRFENKNLEGVTYINFNYTNTIRQYTNKYFKKLEKIIDIHGNVDNHKSIIFGYGDEMTEYYKKLENLDNEIFLKHFKSHYYHSNNSYSQLLYEVENYEFDVVIIGHSLGLSDRLLLNTIFENENCKAIHLTHTGGDSHFRKRIALSRHFDNKKEYRKKLMEEIDFLKIDRN